RQCREAGLYRRHQRRGAGMCLIVVPVIVTSTEREQQTRVQANGILHKGPKTLLASSRINQRCRARGCESGLIAESAHESAVHAANQGVISAGLPRSGQAATSLLCGNVLGAGQGFTVAV